MIVECAVYESGVRRPGQVALEEAFEAAQSVDGFVWIGLHEPTEQEFEAIQREFDLHPLAIEDAVHAHQRPKIELYGTTQFIVLLAARYVDREEVISLSELMLFVGEKFLVTVRHGDSTVLADVRRDLEAKPDKLKWGVPGVMHAIFDRVVDNYGIVLRALDVDIDEIEQEVFSGGFGNRAERIYKLKREVLEFRHAVMPLAEPLDDLLRGRVIEGTQETVAAYFRDIHDHILRIAERVESIDALLTSALSANLAQMGVRQNEDMRKISAWVAILATPTMIAGIYGMNFDHIPELGWLWGYPITLGVMVMACFALFRAFRARGWL